MLHKYTNIYIYYIYIWNIYGIYVLTSRSLRG